MNTIILNGKDSNESIVGNAVKYLSAGEPIAFPTETVYGIGADIFNEQAVKKIYFLKNRQFTKPLAAHISSIDWVEKLCCEIPEQFYLLAEKFLPGPLSIILKKKGIVPQIVTASIPTLGIRFPDNDLALSIIDSFGKPIAATSANESGFTPAIDAVEIIKTFSGKIPLIIDAGLTKYQQESTVMSLAGEYPVVLREGVIPVEDIEEIIKMKIQKTS